MRYLLKLHQSTTTSTWWRSPRSRLGWVEMAVGLAEGPSYPGHSPSFFGYAAPERPQNVSTQLLQNRSPVFTFSFLLPSLALLLLLILLLLMSGNVYTNPGPISPCSVCARNVTWRSKSVKCCTSSKWVHLRCYSPSPNSELLAALTLGAAPLL